MKIFVLAHFARLLVYRNLSRAPTKDQKYKLFKQLQQFCSTYSTQWLSLSKITVAIPGKCSDFSMNLKWGAENQMQ